MKIEPPTYKLGWLAPFDEGAGEFLTRLQQTLCVHRDRPLGSIHGRDGEEARMSFDKSQTIDLLSQPSRVSYMPALKRRALRMAIENRDLPVGTRLVADYKKQTYVCTVESGNEEGSTLFVLEDGKRFKSPSAAGSAVMGGTACNGWRFWSVEGEAPVAKAAKPAKAKAPAKASKPKTRKPKATKLIFRLDDQTGATEGMCRWWCSACMDAFEVFGAEKPEQCPEGHRIDDAELTAPAGVTGDVEAN
jgi:hypothetical protein